MNFWKFKKKLLFLNCNILETQRHIFEESRPIQDQLKLIQTYQVDQVFGSVTEQKEAIIHLNRRSKETVINISSTWRTRCQDHRQIFDLGIEDCKKKKKFF